MSNPSGVRVLLVLPQLPQDPASGAARSTTTIVELLATAGFSVRALASTASEGATYRDPVEYLRSIGITPTVEAPGPRQVRPILRYQHRGIEYTVLHTGHKPWLSWQKTLGAQFDVLFDEELQSFDPDLMVTFGGFPPEVRRMQRARRRGCRVVFSLRNLSYQKKTFFDNVDSVLTPSEFLTRRYREMIGIESTPLLAPLEMGDVLAAQRDPIFVTLVNPSPEKGLMVFARVAEEVSRRNPRIPLLVIESRGTAGLLVKAGLRGGFDLRRHGNIMFSPPVGKPKDIFMPARLLIAPSLVEEAGGRTPAEALVNGVPPIVSDRGALGEICCGGGFVIPIPPEIHPRLTAPVSAGVAEPWVERILELCEDEAAYQDATQRTREAARNYFPETLRPQYVDYFLRVLA